MSVLFHLALPAYDVQLTKSFYCDLLDCHIGRETPHAVIFNFYSHQIVAHKVDVLPDEQDGIYPRHFGLIFLDKNEFNNFIAMLNKKQIIYEIPLKTRFSNTRLEHQSFFLKDPSTNLLEFKHYTYESAIFGERDFKQIGETN